jgi:hypothetical protein
MRYRRECKACLSRPDGIAELIAYDYIAYLDSTRLESNPIQPNAHEGAHQSHNPHVADWTQCSESSYPDAPINTYSDDKNPPAPCNIRSQGRWHMQARPHTSHLPPHTFHSTPHISHTTRHHSSYIHMHLVTRCNSCRRQAQVSAQTPPVQSMAPASAPSSQCGAQLRERVAGSAPDECAAEGEAAEGSTAE